MTQIWKRSWEGAIKVTLRLLESQDDIRGRGFWGWSYEQLPEAPVTQALLGIGPQEAQACSNNTGLRWGGWILTLREKCVVKYRHCILYSLRAQWSPSWKRIRLRAPCLTHPHLSQCSAAWLDVVAGQKQLDWCAVWVQPRCSSSSSTYGLLRKGKTRSGRLRFSVIIFFFSEKILS